MRFLAAVAQVLLALRATQGECAHMFFMRCLPGGALPLLALWSTGLPRPHSEDPAALLPQDTATPKPGSTPCGFYTGHLPPHSSLVT